MVSLCFWRPPEASTPWRFCLGCMGPWGQEPEKDKFEREEWCDLAPWGLRSVGFCGSCKWEAPTHSLCQGPRTDRTWNGDDCRCAKDSWTLGVMHKGMWATTKVSVPNLAEKNKPNTLKRFVGVIRKGHRNLNYSREIFPRDCSIRTYQQSIRGSITKTSSESSWRKLNNFKTL